MNRKRSNDNERDDTKRFRVEDHVVGFQLSDLDGEVEPEGDQNLIDARMAVSPINFRFIELNLWLQYDAYEKMVLNVNLNVMWLPCR